MNEPVNERATGEGGARKRSDSTNSSEKNYSTRRAGALVDYLCATYPVFANYKPLAIGIRDAVRAAVKPGAHSRTVKKALSKHCGCDRYLEAIAAGGPRYNMDGTPVWEITDKQKSVAAEQLAARERERSAPAPSAAIPVVPPLSNLLVNLPVLRLRKRGAA